MSLDVSGHMSRRHEPQPEEETKGRGRDIGEYEDLVKGMEFLTPATPAPSLHQPNKMNKVTSPPVAAIPRPAYTRAKSAMALQSFRTKALLNPKIAGSARFLIPKKAQKSLDLDYHDSTHSRSHKRQQQQQQMVGTGTLVGAVDGADTEGTSTSEAEHPTSDTLAGAAAALSQGDETNETEECLSEDESSVLSVLSDESSCDSFCDADENSAANKDYMVKDLGASFMSGEFDNLDEEKKPTDAKKPNADLNADKDSEEPPPPVEGKGEMDTTAISAQMDGVKEEEGEEEHKQEPPSSS